jgi:hypothetical protein
VALTPLSALAPSASKVLDRIAPPPEARPAPPPKARPWKLLIAGCLALAALTLLGPHVPTYDPWAWIIWGREIAHGDLVTTTGPSWKPLPVFFTVPFSFAGDDGAPLLWLVIARAGGILAFAMAFRLARRLAGPAAGFIAAGALFLADEFIRNFARGNSEGILVALCLWAIERHLDGRRRDAFILGFAAALLRPEVWPFIALYGLYLIASERTFKTSALVIGGGVLLIVLWFVPEYIGSGDLFRAASRAHDPNPDSAAFAKHPFLEVFNRSMSILTWPVYTGAGIAVIAAARKPKEHLIPLAMAAISTILMVSVAAMTQLGFAGNLRYVALPAAFVCVLAGAGWVWLVRAANAKLGTVAAAALVLCIATAAAKPVKADTDELKLANQQVKEEALLYGSVPDVIRAGGGEAKLKSCGTIYTGNFQTQTVAWYLHIHQVDTEIFGYPPGTVIAPTYTYLSRDPRFPVYAHYGHWVIGSSCRR